MDQLPVFIVSNNHDELSQSLQEKFPTIPFINCTAREFSARVTIEKKHSEISISPKGSLLLRRIDIEEQKLSPDERFLQNESFATIWAFSALSPYPVCNRASYWQLYGRVSELPYPRQFLFEHDELNRAMHTETWESTLTRISKERKLLYAQAICVGDQVWTDPPSLAVPLKKALITAVTEASHWFGLNFSWSAWVLSPNQQESADWKMVTIAPTPDLGNFCGESEAICQALCNILQNQGCR